MAAEPRPIAGPVPFAVPWTQGPLHGDRIAPSGPPGPPSSSLPPAAPFSEALILHGAGASDRTRFLELRRELAREGVASAAFDMVGHGQTGGELLGQSLEMRTGQARAVVQGLNLPQPLALLGASMGAHTAIQLLRHFNVRSLVLLVPAVYDRRARDLPFGPRFTKAIRRPGSWRGSDDWDLLANYTGRLLVVAGEKDEVIPREIVEQLGGSAPKAREAKLYMAPGASHYLFTDLRQSDPAAFREAFGLIRDFLAG